MDTEERNITPPEGDDEDAAPEIETTDEAEPVIPALSQEDEPAAALADDETPDELPEDEPFAQASESFVPRDEFDLIGSAMDIDAALAAVASLSDVVADREATEDAEQAPHVPAETPTFLLPTPPATTLRRGSSASLIPAILLIVSGVLLTLATTSGAQISATLVLFGAFAAVALLMLGYWFASRRWSRGTFFFAALLLLSGGSLYVMLQPGGIGVGGMPLLVIAVGVALVLTAFTSRPATRRALLPGVLLIAGGAAALGFTLGVFDPSVLTIAAQFAWVVPVVLIILWLLPMVFRRRE